MSELKITRAELLDIVRESPTSPGVYLMKDDSGNVLYVGKAKHLKNRLTSYFQPAVHPIPRIDLLVSRIVRFDVILTETESEALLLENTLIKKHKPRFNIRLKDDKAYPYLKIQVTDAFPRLEWTRKVRQDEARYFGPFTSATAAREVMELLIETFKLRDCSDNTFKHRSRPCILYQMDKCTAPCVGLITSEDYRTDIREVVKVLEGKGDSMIKRIRAGMMDASEREDFELAANLRDQLRNLELVTSTQVVAQAGSDRKVDVFAIARGLHEEAEAHATILQVRGGKLISVKHYNLQNADASIPDADLFSGFLSQHYLSLTEEERDQIPQDVLLAALPAEMGEESKEVLEKTLGLRLYLARDEQDEQLLNVARANAEYALEQGRKKVKGHSLKALEEIQEKLELSKLPSRIECYDISNTSGEEAVASRVVFVDGAPDKNLYRRYKIKTVVGSNDFAMMKEVLGRRFSRVDEDLPDLVVVDGGKGQLSQAVAILDELQVQGVGVVGLAKARTERDFKAKEVNSSMERIFAPGRKNPVNLLPHTEAYKLLTHVRDEAHRFAITYHRLLRSKKSLKSDS